MDQIKEEMIRRDDAKRSLRLEIKRLQLMLKARPSLLTFYQKKSVSEELEILKTALEISRD
jgi:hypothetical protein